jgi:hypothetical protein
MAEGDGTRSSDYSPLTVPIWTVTTIVVNAGGKAWAPSPRAPNPIPFKA